MCVWGAHPLGMHIQVPSRQLDFVTTSCAAHCQGRCRDGLIRMVRGQQKKCCMGIHWDVMVILLGRSNDMIFGLN